MQNAWEDSGEGTIAFANKGLEKPCWFLTYHKVFPFLFQAGIFVVFINRHWCSGFFRGGICCLLVNDGNSTLDLAALHACTAVCKRLLIWEGKGVIREAWWSTWSCNMYKYTCGDKERGSPCSDTKKASVFCTYIVNTGDKISTGIVAGHARHVPLVWT